MFKHLLLPFYIINLLTSPLFAVDEVNSLQFKTSSPLGSYIQPSLSQLNIDYDAFTPDDNPYKYLEPVLNVEKDSSTYCPQPKIQQYFLTRSLNEPTNIIRQGDDKFKDVFSNYYTVPENALNSRHNVEPLNKDNIYSLAQKIITMADNNVKVKISLEYESPTINKKICHNPCDDVINFASAGNSAAINDLSYANKQPKKKNNIMTFLQNYRPDNINSNLLSNMKCKTQIPNILSKPYFFYPQNSDNLPLDLESSKLLITNPLQSLSQPLSNQTETTLSNQLQNFASLFQSGKKINSHSIQNLTPPLLSHPGNANFFSTQNTAALFQKTTDFPYSSKYLPTLQKPRESPLESTGILNRYPKFNPIKQNFPLQSQIPKKTPNSFPLSLLKSYLQSFKGAKNINSLQNVALFPQNPTGQDDFYLTQNLPTQQNSFTEGLKNIEEYAKQLDEKYHTNEKLQYPPKTQKHIQYKNADTLKYTSENNPTFVSPIKPEYPKTDMLPHYWNQPSYISTNNNYFTNKKRVQEKLIQLHNQPHVLEKTTKNPLNLDQILNKDGFPNIQQYDKRKLKVDSLSSQANILNNYNQYLHPVKDLIYPQTNLGTGQLVNQKIPYSSYNYIPFTYEKNNGLYGTYVKDFYQKAPQYNIPSRLTLYPNIYYNYNPNLGITNFVKGTQEKEAVQFLDLNRLLAVSNLDKLKSVNKNGIVELTYKLSHSKPFAEPYVKYRLPYEVFLIHLKSILKYKPNLRNDPHLLYKDLLNGFNIVASSSDLKNLDKEELLRVVSADGTLVSAKVLDGNDSDASEQIKIIQKLNSNMPLEDIVRTNINITKVPLTRPKYLNDLQRRLTMNNYYISRYNTQANQY